MCTSDSNLRSNPSSVLSKASAAHENVVKKSKHVLGNLMTIKKDLLRPSASQTSKLRFEVGGSDSEAGENAKTEKSALEESSYSSIE